MVGTYASVLLVCGTSILIGQAVLALCGWRRWSWLSPAIGLAVVTALAWGTVRLGYEGLGSLVALLLASAVALTLLRGRVEGVGAAVRIGAPIALLALLVVSIPFALEGRFGILGTGFNVDMSQHLFAADWLAGQNRPQPGLVDQGYPLGPHSLAVAGAELSGAGSLVAPFSGVTIAVPVLAALTSLTVLRQLPGARRVAATLLVAFPYLVASYLAQGSFKELYMGLFLLGFALALHELARGEPRQGPANRIAAAVPLAVLAIGSVYAYSGPGLVWLAGALGLWAALELGRRRRGGADPRRLLRRAALPAALAAAVFAVAVAPEAGRVVTFGGNVSAVADPTDLEPRRDQGPIDSTATVDSGGAGQGKYERRGGPGEGAPAVVSTADQAAGAEAAGGAEAAAGAGESDQGAEPTTRREQRRALYRFNSDFGNLFGQINPLEALGIWPSGDFRVQPGGGGVPALLFYLGAALGALALSIGLRGWLRRGELAVPVALTIAIVGYLGARALSTPYTTAKALQMVAPLAAIVVVRDLLAPGFLDSAGRGIRGTLAGARATPARAALVALFVVAAAASSLLALASAPVGPRNYSSGLARLSSRTDGRPTLILAPPRQVTERHGRSFLGWELRGARPICVEPDDGTRGGPSPPGISFVISSDGSPEAPFDGLELVTQRGQYVLWARTDATGSPPPRVEANAPTECRFEPPA